MIGIDGKGESRGVLSECRGRGSLGRLFFKDKFNKRGRGLHHANRGGPSLTVEI